MAWQLAMVAASTALSVYGSAQQARGAAEAARARAIANAQTAKNLRTEAAGRRLINLERLDRANSSIIASAGARGVQVDSASNLAQIAGNKVRHELDNLSIDLSTEQRIANLWADSDAAYRKAQLTAQAAGISAFQSMLNAGATAVGSYKAANAGQQVTKTGSYTDGYQGADRYDLSWSDS